MEMMMKHVILALAATFALSAPVAAQTMTVLLPVISFPDPILTPSTKGCDVVSPVPVCQLQE
jgi:hypothetical protein